MQPILRPMIALAGVGALGVLGLAIRPGDASVALESAPRTTRGALADDTVPSSGAGPEFHGQDGPRDRSEGAATRSVERETSPAAAAPIEAELGALSSATDLLGLEASIEGLARRAAHDVRIRTELLRLLARSDAEAITWAGIALALGRVGDPVLAESLLDLADAEGDPVRRGFLCACVGQHPEAGVVRLAFDGEELARAPVGRWDLPAIWRSLARFQVPATNLPRACIERLVRDLHGATEPDHALGLIRALRGLVSTSPEAREAIASRVAGGKGAVGLEAARVLGDGALVLGGRELLDEALRLIDAGSDRTADTLALRLAASEDPSVAAALQTMLADPRRRPATREAIVLGLARTRPALDGEAGRAIRLAARRPGDTRVRRAAVRGLRSIRGWTADELATTLGDLLADPDPVVRAEAIECAAALDVRRLEPRIRNMTGGREVRVVRHAASIAVAGWNRAD